MLQSDQIPSLLERIQGCACWPVQSGFWRQEWPSAGAPIGQCRRKPNARFLYSRVL